MYKLKRPAGLVVRGPYTFFRRPFVWIPCGKELWRFEVRSPLLICPAWHWHSPNSYIHVSVSDLYIPRIAHRNVEVGTEPQFLFWEYLLNIFGIVSLHAVHAVCLSAYRSQLHGTSLHCIKAKYYPAQKSVIFHSGLDSKAMHSFTAQICFPQSSEMTMDTSPVNSIWLVAARYGREIHWSWLFQPHG